MLMEDREANEGALHVIILPVPDGFPYEDALQRLAPLLIQLLSSGMPEREAAKRLIRYHPAQEG